MENALNKKPSQTAETISEVTELLRTGKITQNQIREQFGMPRVEHPLADVLFQVISEDES